MCLICLMRILSRDFPMTNSVIIVKLPERYIIRPPPSEEKDGNPTRRLQIVHYGGFVDILVKMCTIFSRVNGARAARKRDSSVEKYGKFRARKPAYHSRSSMTNRELCSPIIFYFFACTARTRPRLAAVCNASGNFQIIAPRFSPAISRLIPHVDKAR